MKRVLQLLLKIKQNVQLKYLSDVVVNFIETFIPDHFNSEQVK